MTQKCAPVSPAIKCVTGLVLAMISAFLIMGLKVPGLLAGAAVLGTITLFCYLHAPVNYELTGDQLTVRCRWGQKVFPAVSRCSLLTARPPMGLRLWGNGGLFAATGIFWNKTWGVYRAYVTSARHQDFVLVETPTHKILISPEKPEILVQTWAAATPGSST